MQHQGGKACAVSEGYKRCQEGMCSVRGVQEVSEGYKRCQEGMCSVRGVQEVSEGYKRYQGSQRRHEKGM